MKTTMDKTQSVQ